jgi:hypothetical protein
MRLCCIHFINQIKRKIMTVIRKEFVFLIANNKSFTSYKNTITWLFIVTSKINI